MKPEEIGATLRKKYQEAVDLLREQETALQVDPEDYALKIRFNSFSRHVDDLKRQLDAFEAFDKGWHLFNENKYIEAKKEFSRSMDLVPSYLGFLHNQLMANLAPDGEWQMAIFAMRFVLELDPNYEIARENLAIAYINFGIEEAKQGNLSRAADLFHLSLSVSDTNDIVNLARNNLAALSTVLGVNAHHSGDLMGAVKSMLRACTFTSSEITRHNAGLSLAFLAQYQLSIGNWDDAVKNFEQAEDTGLITSEFLNVHAIALAHAGRVDEAIAKFESALELSPAEQIAEAIKANKKIAQEVLKERQLTMQFNVLPFIQSRVTVLPFTGPHKYHIDSSAEVLKIAA